MKKNYFITVIVFFFVAEGIALFKAGTEDQLAFFFWTSLPALLAGFLGNLFVQLTKTWNKILSYFSCLIIGGIFGLFWTFIVVLFLGPWIGAFGAPVLLCWIAGGAASFFAAKAYVDLPLKKFFPFIIISSLTISVLVFVIPDFLFLQSIGIQILSLLDLYEETDLFLELQILKRK